MFSGINLRKRSNALDGVKSLRSAGGYFLTVLLFSLLPEFSNILKLNSLITKPGKVFIIPFISIRRNQLGVCF